MRFLFTMTLALGCGITACEVDSSAVTTARQYALAVVTRDSTELALHAQEGFDLPISFDSAVGALELDSAAVAQMPSKVVKLAGGATTVFFTLPPGTVAGDCDLVIHTVQGPDPKVSWLDFEC